MASLAELVGDLFGAVGTATTIGLAVQLAAEDDDKKAGDSITSLFKLNQEALDIYVYAFNNTDPIPQGKDYKEAREYFLSVVQLYNDALKRNMGVLVEEGEYLKAVVEGIDQIFDSFELVVAYIFLREYFILNEKNDDLYHKFLEVGKAFTEAKESVSSSTTTHYRLQVNLDL